MIIDSSAILAVIGKEPGYERIVHELAASPRTRIGAPTRLETGIVLMAGTRLPRTSVTAAPTR